MARVLVILAFMLCLGTAVPVLNVLSPYSSSYQTKVPSSSFNTPLILGAAGCSTSTTGAASCTAGLNNGNGNTGIFGTLVSTVLVFGNFFAAAQFLITVGAGVLLPGAYVLEWTGGAGNIAAIALAALVQGMVWMAYAELLFYIFSGRWLE
jgi:hypothetical protein